MHVRTLRIDSRAKVPSLRAYFIATFLSKAPFFVAVRHDTSWLSASESFGGWFPDRSLSPSEESYAGSTTEEAYEEVARRELNYI